MLVGSYLHQLDFAVYSISIFCTFSALPPNLQTVPQQYHGRNQKFSSHMGQAGMSTRTGLSTAKDTSKVHSSLD
eukprot:m.9649 g.9649  ORF g.9649 m.9649 type:complete len:74 (-) comp5478_c0_seq1:126-347(-)